jgi:hypothetical protein
MLIASAATGAALAPPAGLPEALRGLPPKARQAAAAIQQAVQNQHDLIERAKQARTPEEREEIFHTIARNVRAIAQQRVAVLEEHTKLARARVAWAREHADQVKVQDLARAAVKRDAPGQPRSPFEQQDPPRPERGPLPQGLARLPASVAEARGTVEQSLARLETLREQAGKARSDKERTAIRREIERHLKVIEKQRVTILEAALEVSEKRLAWARKRAEQ